MVLNGISMAVKDPKGQQAILAKMKEMAACIASGGNDCASGICVLAGHPYYRRMLRSLYLPGVTMHH